MSDPLLIRGTLHLYNETGTEGGYWAIQDERFIEPADETSSTARWSYDGLYPLEDGDHLKITAPDGSIYWEGFISLKQHPVFTEGVDVHVESTGEDFSIWIHADQSGLDRKFWATPFFKFYQGELIRGIKS